MMGGGQGMLQRLDAGVLPQVLLVGGGDADAFAAVVRGTAAHRDDGVTAVVFVHFQAVVAVFDLRVGLHAGEHHALDARFLQGSQGLGHGAVLHPGQEIIGYDQRLLHVQKLTAMAQLLYTAGAHEIDGRIQKIIVPHTCYLHHCNNTIDQNAQK